MKQSRSVCRKIAATLRERWTDPIFRSHMTKVRKKQVTSEERKRLRKELERNWDDPKMRKKLVKHLREISQSKEGRKDNSRRMKKLWKDPQYRAKQTKAIHNKKWHKNVAEANTRTKTGTVPWNRFHTKDTHPSLMAASLKLKGHLPKFNLFKRWYPSEDNRRIEMRSSWEVSFALWLDAGGIEWEYETKYFHVGRGIWKGETYTPDFYLQEQNVYVELKGHLTKENAAKMKRFYKLYPDVQLWMFEYKHLKSNVLQFKKAA